MIEAMACGTPVVAYGNGAVSEVVKHGKTGYVVNPREIESGDYSDFVDANSKIDGISREECKKHVENNFAVDRQVRNYLDVYRDMILRVSESSYVLEHLT